MDAATPPASGTGSGEATSMKPHAAAEFGSRFRGSFGSSEAVAHSIRGSSSFELAFDSGATALLLVGVDEVIMSLELAFESAAESSFEFALDIAADVSAETLAPVLSLRPPLFPFAMTK